METEQALALKKAALRTFEELGYLLPTEAVSPQQRTCPQEAELSVAFDGPVRGRLLVRLYGSNTPAIASNMLGEDGPVDANLSADALGELANVITGNALPEIYPSRGFFRLGKPVVLLAGFKPHPGVQWVEVGLEKGRAELGVMEDSGGK